MIGQQTLFKIFAVALSLGGSIALGEIALRYVPVGPQVFPSNGTYRLSSDPRLGYELVPGSRDGESFISADGLRDATFARNKPDGTFRVAVIGDSVAFGYRVRQSEAMPKVLERLLNEFRPGGAARYEVMNFGVEG
jgi:hypothetical protein